MSNLKRQKMDSSTNDKLRSLNDFPEHLLIHILSFLPTIDAIKASSISRRWRNLWSSIPSLNFSYDLFQPFNSPSDTRRRFAVFVNRVLILRNPQSPPLHTFRLQFDYKEYRYTSLIESWIQYAINHHVLDLDLDFYIDQRFHVELPPEEEEEPWFELLFYALRNSQVRVLKLSRCYLSPMYMSGVKFASIRSVFLDQVELMDQMVSDLLIGCPNIESLTFEYCYGLEHVKIFSLKIKELALKYFSPGVGWSTSVEIDCPNLQSLDIDGFEVDNYSLKNSSALVEASVYFRHALEFYEYWSKVVKLLGHVKKLTVQNWWFKLHEQKELCASFKLHNLRWLELRTESSKSELLGIALLLELSPKLETLILDDLYKIDEDENISDELINKPINLSLPRLRLAEMNCFTGTENEYLFLDLLKKQGVVCQKIVVVHVEDGVIYPPVVWVRNPNGAEVQGSPPHWEQLVSN